MARPQKNNCEYFPHLTTMRNHRKVKALRNKFGPVKGYAFWSMLLEYLTELDGNELEFSSMECDFFAAELGVSAAEIPPMIEYCIEIELLFKTDTNFIYSDSLNEALKPVYDKRGREREKSKSRQRHENGVFASDNSTTGGVSAAEIPQSKVKETKQKERVKFTPPTLSEIQSYFSVKIKEKGLNLNPVNEAEKFESFYGSINWMVGKNKMSDWQKAVSGWIARAKDQSSSKSLPTKQTTNQNVIAEW